MVSRKEDDYLSVQVRMEEYEGVGVTLPYWDQPEPFQLINTSWATIEDQGSTYERKIILDEEMVCKNAELPVKTFALCFLKSQSEA